MRGRLASLASLVQRGGLAGSEGVATTYSVVNRLPSVQPANENGQSSLMRGYAGPAHHAPPVPTGPKTPLQQIMPQVISLVPSVLKLAYGTAKGLVYGIATSGQVKSLVSQFGNNVIVAERLLELKDMDLPTWSSWLAGAGYTDKAGWAKIVEALKPKVPSLKPAEVSAVVGALGCAGYYDKELFTALSAVISEHFMEFETPCLATIATVFSSNDHYSVELFDDVADGIAYCNHYMAPMFMDVTQIAGVFEAYAKYSHDRTDMFVGLARAITEDKLIALEGKAAADTTLSLLKSFDKFDFWPDVTEGLFVVADAKAADLSEDDKKFVAATVEKVETYAGGKLEYYREGASDPAHYHGPSFGDYNLWAFRGSLVPKFYSPAAVKAWKQ